MKQITEDYVSFEIAKLLKEKWFKQDCDYATSWYAAEYYKNSAQGEWFEGEHQIIEDSDDKCTISYLSDKGVFIPAPTLQMTMKWLREVHAIVVVIFPIRTVKGELAYNASIYNTNAEHKKLMNKDYRSYEQAVEAALKYSLENLI